MKGKRMIHRLIWIEAVCFAALVVFINIDDEYLIPRFVPRGFSMTKTELAGLLDSIWVVCLFFLALYIQLKDMHKIKLLEGMLSVCANCKRIRDGENQWSPIEEYIHQRSHADFSHTICPDCGVKLYGELYLKAADEAADKSRTKA